MSDDSTTTPERTPDEYQAEIDRLMQRINDLEEERDEARKEAATATDKHAKATAANAEIARERDAAKALCETALKAQKRAEDARDGAVSERDAIRKKNSDLHKQVNHLLDVQRRQSQAIQTFVGAASRPVSGPCELVIRSKPVNGLSEVTFDIPAGYSLFSSDIVADRHWVRMTRTAAAEVPVDDAPEQGDTDAKDAIPQAA